MNNIKPARATININGDYPDVNIAIGSVIQRALKDTGFINTVQIAGMPSGVIDTHVLTSTSSILDHIKLTHPNLFETSVVILPRGPNIEDVRHGWGDSFREKYSSYPTPQVIHLTAALSMALEFIESPANFDHVERDQLIEDTAVTIQQYGI